MFGGHPTISPIVLQIASILHAGQRVSICQSEEFRSRITDEVYRLAEVEGANLRFTPQGDSLASSLEAMRRSIFEAELRAAFFVGGMSGIAEEFNLLHERQPTAMRFLFKEPGGMAARLGASAGEDLPDSEFASEIWPSGESTFVLAGRAYGSLALRSLRLAGVGRPVDSEGEM